MGSGFDVVGMALKLHNTVQFEKSDRFKVHSIGRYGLEIGDAVETFGNAIERFEKLTGKRVPAIQIIQECEIPPARGLGSSAAAIASALFISNIMTGGRIPTDALLEIGTEIEGHPDNIVPCMVGGLTVSYYDGSRLDYEKFEMPDHRLTFLVPEFKLSTEAMRKALPDSIPFKDALGNIKNVSQFISKASRGDFAGALKYTKDFIHHTYRINSDPRTTSMMTWARAAASAAGSTSNPAATALSQAAQPGASATITERPLSRMFCACAWPWLPNPMTAMVFPASRPRSASAS